MKQRLSEQITSYHNAHARKKRWKRIVMVLSCIVVFCTTYALILPAITMTQTPDCGKEAHSHEDACYETVIEYSDLHCPQPEHSHDDACYDAEGKLICGYSDFVIHKHDTNCFSKSGELICTLPEIQKHAHTEACHETRTELLCGADALEGHRHSEQCYEQRLILSCQQEESEDHSHGESCYTTENELVCGKEEQEPHSYTEACEKAQQRLICTRKEAIPHEHTADCYSNGMLVCGMMQALCHQHGEGCFASVEEKKNLICGKDEHIHEPACYGAVDTPEAAYHCGMGEHLHEEECYDENYALTCSIPEHTHTEECVENTPSFACGLPEHTHTEMCKDEQGTLICRLEEHTHDHFCIAVRSAPPMPVQGNDFIYAGAALQGAEFDLYQWKNNEWSKVNQTPLITGTDGMVKLQPLEASVAYKLVETKAPPHYVLKDNAAFFWLREDENQTAPNSMPDGFVGKAVEIGGVLLISGDKAQEQYTSITVKKLWKTEEGADLPAVPVETITIRVYQIPDGNEDAKVERTQLTLSAANGWETVLPNLPAIGEDENGNPVTYDYSVEEISVSGFETSCAREENLFTITNTRKQQEYTLPETGGAGKGLFTTGGALFLITSLLLGCRRSRKRERRCGSLQ